MLRRIFASAAVGAVLVAAFASTPASASSAGDASKKTLACYSNGTPCDNNGTCCSSLCVHHKCIKN